MDAQDTARRLLPPTLPRFATHLGGHLSIRLGKTDLALSALERAALAAEAFSDPLLSLMVYNSVAWAYQRQNRLEDAQNLAVHAADEVEREHTDTAEGLRRMCAAVPPVPRRRACLSFRLPR
ncbi:hypothetical protein ABH925_001041 [Streptacidiphilus sp. EB129]